MICLNYCVLRYLLLTKLKNINNNKLRKYSNFHLTRFSFYPLLLSFNIWAVAVHWVLYFYKGEHTRKTQDMLKTGFIVFMAIESLLFFSLFFFAFLYIAVYIPLYVSSVWPDLGINSEMSKLLSEFMFIGFIISICVLLTYRKFMSGIKLYQAIWVISMSYCTSN